MGIFIRIDVRQDLIDPRMAEKVASVCPVEIFGLSEEMLVVQPEREDECTLCELCLDAAPGGSLIIRKLYKDESLVSRAGKA